LITTVGVEPLGGGRKILVSETHRFGTDAFLLAHFAAPRSIDNAVDLGTGCGIIPTLWLGRQEVRTCIGIELSQEACELAKETIQLNGDGIRFDVINMDLRELGKTTAGDREKVAREKFDLVVCNPPYFTGNSGYTSPDPERAKTRTEHTCTIADVCEAARFLLRYGGRLCVCHRPERLPDVFCTMREYGIEPKRLRMVQQRPEKAPWLVLVEGRRGGNPHLDILPPMIMKDEKGGDSPELAALYGSYREGSRSWNNPE